MPPRTSSTSGRGTVPRRPPVGEAGLLSSRRSQWSPPRATQSWAPPPRLSASFGPLRGACA
eukprot:11976175-Alexandrium_andersonii.AAC.1